VLNPSFISNVSHCKTLTRVFGNSKKFCDFFFENWFKCNICHVLKIVLESSMMNFLSFQLKNTNEP
jgi:hypothetical protein